VKVTYSEFTITVKRSLTLKDTA